MPFTPTAEQQAILDAFTDGKNLVIQAGAGTGKTTTLKLLSRSTGRRGTYLAFNKAIAAAAKTDFGNTVRAMTAHSLAWSEHGRQFADRMNADRQGWTPTIEFLNATPMSFRLPDRTRRTLSAYQVARHAIETVKTYCQSNDLDITARHVPTVPGLDSPDYSARHTIGQNHADLCERILPMARRAWADAQRTEGVITFDHAFYLKGWALTNPTIGGDYLLFDEAQDASPVIAGVVNRQTHLQRIFVGDTAQQIMAFAGAVDAMEKFATNQGVEVLPLTESFRFGPRIAEAANVFLTDLHAPLRLTGTPTIDSTITTLDLPALGSSNADAVLCRTNAGALNEVISLQNSGRRVCLLGGANELRRFVEAARDLQATGKTNLPLLMAFDSWAQVEDHVANAPGGDELETMVELVNEYGADVLLNALTRCTAESAAEVTVSTAHKAKGREWDAVRISNDFELDPEAPPAVRSAETMLAYVAITRAKRLLDPGLLGETLKVARESLPTTPAPAAPAAPSIERAAPPLPEPFAPTPDEPPFGAPADAALNVGHFVSIPAATYDRLAAAANAWGGTPDAFALRLIEGALSALTDPANTD